MKIYIFIFFSFFLFSCTTYKVKQADKQYALNRYAAASQRYQRIYPDLKLKDASSRALIAFRLGECYRHMGYTIRALNNYKNALRNKYPDKILLLRTAQMLHKSGLYEEAITYYEQYLIFHPHDLITKNGIAGCRIGLEQIAKPENYQVNQVAGINATRSDYCPVFPAGDKNSLWFISTRLQNKKEKADPVTGLTPSRVYQIKRDKEGRWQKPSLEESFDSSVDYMGGFVFSSDYNRLYYTVTTPVKKKTQISEIYQSVRIHDRWQEGIPISFSLPDEVSIAHPALSADGRYLYFTSDLPGGYGGWDIYRAYLYRDSIGVWENLGPEINTPGNELYPYWHDNIFYFSSDGHPGLGGLDIFKAIPDGNDKWNLVSLEPPLNSCADDFGLLLEEGEQKGFISSNRNNIKGYSGIYKFEKNPYHIEIEGVVADQQGDPLPYSTIRVVGRNGIHKQIRTDKDGNYRFRLEPDSEYVMMASLEGYQNQTLSFHTDNLEINETYLINFSLSPVGHLPERYVLYYDFDKYKLTFISETIVEEIIILLHNNPSIVLEITGHTDHSGNEEYNYNLSEKRVKEIVDYLVDKGITPERLTGKGKGHFKPKQITFPDTVKYPFFEEGNILNQEYIEQLNEEEKEIANQLNRRVELKIIQPDSGLFIKN